MSRAARLFALLLGFAALFCSACSKKPEPVELEVMSFNLRHNVDWWEERFPLIADEIARLKPDLIGFQEVEIADDQATWLQGQIAARDPQLEYEFHQELKTDLAALSGEGIAVFSRAPIVARLSKNLMYGRVAIFDRIRVSNRLTIDLYNTHLHSDATDDVRKTQMDAVLAMMAENDHGYITLLTGDMNATPDSQTIRTALDAGLIDSYFAVHGAETARIGNTSPIVLAQMPVMQNPVHRIDYVFLKTPPSGVSVEAKTSSIAFDHPNASGLYPSDHLGLMTTFVIDLSTLE